MSPGYSLFDLQETAKYASPEDIPLVVSPKKKSTAVHVVAVDFLKIIRDTL
jgi:hypothetical protein